MTQSDRPPRPDQIKLTGLRAFAAVMEHGSLVAAAGELNWSEGRGNGLELVARTGSQAPGLPAGVLFAGFSNTPSINNAGQTAFRSLLAGTDVGDGNSEAIWSESGDQGLQMIARTGDPAPGGAAVFDNFGDPAFNGAGHVAFRGFLTGPGVTDNTDEGIWSEGRGDGLELIARAGQQAPDTPAGVEFLRFSSAIVPGLNSSGQTAFLATLTGPGVDFSNNEGLWAEDRSGVLRLIVRKGDQIDLDDDPLVEELHTVTSLRFQSSFGSGNQDGRMSGFNDRGEVTFYASFNNSDQGVFVSSRVAVPEPTTLGLALAILPLVLVRMRRQRG